MEMSRQNHEEHTTARTQKPASKTESLAWKKSLGSYKDYAISIHDVWAESCVEYQTILVLFFGKSLPELPAALIQFYKSFLRSIIENLLFFTLAIDISNHFSKIQLSDTTANDPDRFILQPDQE